MAPFHKSPRCLHPFARRPWLWNPHHPGLLRREGSGQAAEFWGECWPLSPGAGSSVSPASLLLRSEPAPVPFPLAQCSSWCLPLPAAKLHQPQLSVLQATPRSPRTQPFKALLKRHLRERQLSLTPHPTLAVVSSLCIF